MRYAALEKNGNEVREVVLIMPNAEFAAIQEAVEAAVKANPRKTTWKRVLASLDKVPAFTW